MIEIPVAPDKYEFTSPIFFVRTCRERKGPAECTKEELLDLMCWLLSRSEKVLANAEKVVEEMEDILGYNEVMRISVAK